MDTLLKTFFTQNLASASHLDAQRLAFATRSISSFFLMA
jgi:hypothetical protein